MFQTGLKRFHISKLTKSVDTNILHHYKALQSSNLYYQKAHHFINIWNITLTSDITSTSVSESPNNSLLTTSKHQSLSSVIALESIDHCDQILCLCLITLIHKTPTAIVSSDPAISQTSTSSLISSKNYLGVTY